MAVESVYDRIGRGYAAERRTDPRIAAPIWRAMGDADPVLDVGAGTGNYEPSDRRVVAVEPSTEMLRQRVGAAPALRAVAESLPFADDSFAATLCVLTIHHWKHLDAGLAELRRVAERQVIFMFDAAVAHRLWLVEDYFPEIAALPTERRAPSVTDLRDHLDVRSVATVPIPADCVDGFAGCYWSRPEAYLEPGIRRAMSCFATLGAEVEARGVAKLRADLASGAWDARHGHLRDLDAFDLGYRLVVSG